MENNEINSNIIRIEGKKENNSFISKTDDKIRKDKPKSYTIIPHKIDFNLNSKYDNALLEELFNSKEKSWRNDIINYSPEKEDTNKKLKKKFSSNQNLFFNSKENLDSNNNIKTVELNKEDDNFKDNNIPKESNNNERFKDFDEILFLEDTKDKKRKNSSAQKLISIEKDKKIPEHIEKKVSMDLNEDEIKDNFNQNLHIIEEVMEKEERNKNEFIKENKEDNLINNNLKIYKENMIEDNHKFISDINNKEEKIHNMNTRNNIDCNYLNQNTNSTNENNIINKYNSINLEYSEDKKKEEEKVEQIDNVGNDKKDTIINEENITNNNNIFTTPRQHENKFEGNTIKNNGSIHYIDLENTLSKRNNFTKTKKNIPNSNHKSLIKNTKNNGSQFHNLMNTIDTTKPKEKMKIENKNTKQNNIINNSKTINVNNALTKNKKNNSSSKSQKNLFFYLLEENKKIIKPKNNPISYFLFSNYSSSSNANKNNTFFNIKNLKREINYNNNSQNIMKNIKINRIKNALNNIDISKLNKKHSYKIKFNEEKNIIEENDINQKNCDKEDIFYKTKKRNILHSEKTKIKTNSFFPLYNNFFNDNQKYKKSELLLNNKDDFFEKKKEIPHQNSFFNAYSTKKMKKNNINFNDFKKDEFFQYNKKKLNKETYRNFNYENNKIFNQLNNNYKNNSFSSSKYKIKSQRNNSSFLINNLYNNRTTNNTINKYKEKNHFQNYIEKKGNEIFSGINNLKYNGYKKVKTNVLPANPFDNIYFL